MLGAVNFSRDNLRQAEMYLTQAVRANVGGQSVRRLLAETQLRLDKPEEALAGLQIVQEQGETDAMLLSMLGRAEIGAGDIDSAIKYFEQGALSAPTNPAIALSLAASYMEAGRDPDAIRVLEGMEDRPGSQYRRETLLIGSYLREDRRDDAISFGDEILNKHAADASANTLVGVLHKSIGNLKRAENLFNESLSLDSNNLGALYNLGAMAVTSGDMDLADTRFQALLDSHPAYVPGLVSMAAILQHDDRLNEMRPRLAAAIDIAPRSIAPRVLLARLELSEGELNVAMDVINSAQEISPEEAGLHHLKGLVFHSNGQVENALQSFERAAAASPDNKAFSRDLASTRLAIGDIEMERGSPNAALEHYEVAADVLWTRAAAIRLARTKQVLGLSSPIESLERWLSENPDDSEARLTYAQLLETGGDTDQAVVEYERLRAAGELNAIGMNNLAWRYFVEGNSSAIELAEEAHRLDPDNGSITDTLGWILFKAGESDRAVELLTLAASQSPDNPAIRDHLNSALAKK